MSFGRNLQRLRQQAKLSQAGLAAKAGIPVKTLQNWEIDRNQPRLDGLLKLSRALGVALEGLTAGLKRVAKGRPAAGGRSGRGSERPARPRGSGR